tara:strand:+ start:650 stop:1576 length:927 start_codon:yes stop_codon:yes gene_type:complete
MIDSQIIETDNLTLDVLRNVLDGAIYKIPSFELSKQLRLFTHGYLSNLAESKLGKSFPTELEKANDFLDSKELKELLDTTYESKGDIETPARLIAKFLQDRQLADKVLIDFKEHLRIVGPGGNLRQTHRVPPHRDSFYSLPKEGINFWIPCTDAPFGVSVYPQLFKTHLRVGKIDSATSHHKILEPDLSIEPATNLGCDFGYTFLFSGDHLHESTVNESNRTRISWDYRLVLTEAIRPGLRIGDFINADLMIDESYNREIALKETRTRLRMSKKHITALFHGIENSGLNRYVQKYRKLKDYAPGVFYC